MSAWLLEMVWRDVCFVHWRADGERLERTLPPGVTLDRLCGEAWLSVVPFRMTGIRARGVPVMPGFGDVPEINLRTYVRVGAVRGVWFYSLDADSPLVVRAARLATGLPYFDARIVTSETDDGISYTSRRVTRGGAPGSFSARYAAPSREYPAAADALTAFLHERYWFFAQRGQRLVRGEVRHLPWSIGTITVDIAHNTLGELVAHPLTDPPDCAYFAREQHVRAGRVQRVRA